MFVIQNHQDDQPSLLTFESSEALDLHVLVESDYKITSAGNLLELYVKTDEDSALMPVLKRVREHYVDDLDLVETAAEVTGLMFWLMADHGVENRGESLEATADRLSDIDIEADSDRYTDLIFHLKDAVERIYDLDMESW